SLWLSYASLRLSLSGNIDLATWINYAARYTSDPALIFRPACFPQFGHPHKPLDTPSRHGFTVYSIQYFICPPICQPHLFKSPPLPTWWTRSIVDCLMPSAAAP